MLKQPLIIKEGWIQKDESFRSHITDFMFDDPEAVKALGLDGENEMPGQAKFVASCRSIHRDISLNF